MSPICQTKTINRSDHSALQNLRQFKIFVTLVSAEFRRVQASQTASPSLNSDWNSFDEFRRVQASQTASPSLNSDWNSFAEFRRERVQASQTASPSLNSGESLSLSDWISFAEFRTEFKLSDRFSFAECRREFKPVRPLLLRLIEERV